MRRTRLYGEREWAAIRTESEQIADELARLMAAGVPAADPRAGEVVELHRDHISRWFYECSAQVHRGLGEMYVADARFTQNWDRHAPGLARRPNSACCNVVGLDPTK